MANPRRPKQSTDSTARDLHADEQRPIEARKQTEHKLDLWRRYTGRYLSIIAKAHEKNRFFRGDHIFLVDLFAGAGRHASTENPLREVPGTGPLACYAARSVQRSHPKTKVHVRLSDYDEVWRKRLEVQVSEYARASAFPDLVDVTVETADYAERIGPILAETRYAPGRNFYSLWLIDPFALQLPMSSLTPLLSAPGVEIIINLDAGNARREIIAVTDYTNKVTREQRISMAAPLDRLLGSDAWRHAFDGAENTERELNGIARTYAEAFEPFFEFRRPYKLRSSDAQHRYLIHLSNHPRAAEAFEKDYDASRKVGNAKGNSLGWTDRTKICAALMEAFPNVEMGMDELQAQTVVLLNRQQVKLIREFACDQDFATLDGRTQKIRWNKERKRAQELELYRVDTAKPGAQLDFFN